MRTILVCASLWLVVATSHGNETVANENARQLAAAGSAVKTLAGALKAELQTAMQSGGPVAAIEVCNTRALPLTQRIASENDMYLARISLRNRNPANAPNQWQREVLDNFERRRAQGEAPDSLVHTETVETGDGREFRFMKAIPTAGICLTCHGTQLPPEVDKVLSGLYPEDLATGFSEGDIRGAFVVTKTLSE